LAKRKLGVFIEILLNKLITSFIKYYNIIYKAKKKKVESKIKKKKEPKI